MNQYRWLGAAVMGALIFPRIAQRGMFLDGVTYAVIARNMAEGAGSLWRPYFSETVYPVFFEQPPLGLALQSVAFRALGDHLIVERAFSIVMFAVTALLVMAIWRRFLSPRYDSLPLFFWILPSVVTWAVINNILENTQVVFTTLAVYAVLGAGAARRSQAMAWWVVTAALAVVAACLTKGPVGLFPLVSPLLLLLAPREQRPSAARALAVTAALIAICVAVAAALLMFEGPRDALTGFADTHLAPALKGERGLPRRSSDIARHLTLGIWARMAALVALLWIARRRRYADNVGVPRVALVFFAIGLSASAPVLVSPVLAGHYFVPSIPFFALAAAAVSWPAVLTFSRRESDARPNYVAGAVAIALTLLVVVVLATRGPMERRDVRLLAGLDAVATALPRGTVIGGCANAASDWGVHSYLQRFFRVSLDAAGEARNGWFLVRENACGIPPGCQRASGDDVLQLYRCTP